MGRTLYLINPRSAIPGYFGADVIAGRGLAAAVGIADLATTTVAALAPQHWNIRLCDEHLSPADLETDADYVGLTGKVTQLPRMIELAHEFRRRGRIVIAGGPYASLAPDALRPHIDVLVRGEIETIASQLFADLEAGHARPEYLGDKPDLSRSPLPRWELYPNERAMIGCVQTSRGCPFQCEFCDVIAYLGRNQRHKPVAQVLAELDVLYEAGYRRVFLADDNFTVYRARTRELLQALRTWNLARTDGPMFFSTQVSMDVARDTGLVALCAAAGIEWVFIGIETPNVESLRECKKPQNLLVDPYEGIDVFLRCGIAVCGGMIVGFDHDGPDIFERQHDFAMNSAVPVFSIGALVAPEATPLHARLSAAGRLIEDGPEVAALPWNTNIVPQRLSREELLSGLRILCNDLYRPQIFAARLERMVTRLAPHPLGAHRMHPPRDVELDATMIVKQLGRAGAEEAKLLRTTFRLLSRYPHATRQVIAELFRYAQIRFMYTRGGFSDIDSEPGGNVRALGG